MAFLVICNFTKHLSFLILINFNLKKEPPGSFFYSNHKSQNCGASHHFGEWALNFKVGYG